MCPSEGMPAVVVGIVTILHKPRAGVGQRIFIGEQYDAATQLSYLNARYYDGTKAKFISEDPTFLGDPRSYAARATPRQILCARGLQCPVCSGIFCG
jgi:RHS repeat-associated protein